MAGEEAGICFLTLLKRELRLIATTRLAQILLLSALLAAVGCTFATAALAHEGGPQLIVDAGQFASGEPLAVRGANLGSDLVVRIELAGDGQIIPLGEAVCDGHGDFAQTFALPEDLPAGTFTLQAIDPTVPGAEVVIASLHIRINNPDWLARLGVAAGC